MSIGGTLEQELERTAELLKEIIQRKNGLYFAVAFLADASYDNKRLHKLLPYLK